MVHIWDAQHCTWHSLDISAAAARPLGWGRGEGMLCSIPRGRRGGWGGRWICWHPPWPALGFNSNRNGNSSPQPEDLVAEVCFLLYLKAEGRSHQWDINRQPGRQNPNTWGKKWSGWNSWGGQIIWGRSESQVSAMFIGSTYFLPARLRLIVKMRKKWTLRQGEREQKSVSQVSALQGGRRKGCSMSPNGVHFPPMIHNTIETETAAKPYKAATVCQAPFRVLYA